MKLYVFFIAMAILIFTFQSSKHTDMPSLPALIINGKKDGSSDYSRYDSSVEVCNKFGLSCRRTPAIFVNMDMYKKNCGDHTTKSKKERYRRGCMFAHRVAMETIAKSEERHIVFEDDIIVSDDYDVKGKLSKFLHSTENDDIAYIGHCFNGMCMHAFAITPEGAKKALELVDWCDGDKAIDGQLKDLCMDGKLGCSYAPAVSWWQAFLRFLGFETESEDDGLVWQKNDGSTVRDQAWF